MSLLFNIYASPNPDYSADDWAAPAASVSALETILVLTGSL
jgi:hypothetical protein